MFFFLGLLVGIGGVLKECDFDVCCVVFDVDLVVCVVWWWYVIGGVLLVFGMMVVSLFVYENLVVDVLFVQWCDGLLLVFVFVFVGCVLLVVVCFFGVELFVVGVYVCSGNLIVYGFVFVLQFDYDVLLWVVDFNFVCGEDLFVCV